MTSQPPFSSNLALQDPSEERTTAKAFREASRSQSPQNPMRQSSLSNPSTPKRKIFEQLPDNSNPHIVKTDGSVLGRSPSRTMTPKASSALEEKSFGEKDLTVEKLIEKVDNVLKKKQSPTIPLNLVEKADIPSYNQFTPLNNTMAPVSGQNQPIISDISRQRESSTPTLKQSINPGAMSPGKQRKNDIFVKKDYGDVLKNNQLGMPLDNVLGSRSQTPKASPLFANLKFPDSNPMSRNDMSDHRSRISSVDNQRPNNIFNNPYSAPVNQTASASRNEIIFPITPKEAHKKSALPPNVPSQERSRSPGERKLNTMSPMTPTQTYYPPTYSPNKPNTPLNNNLRLSPTVKSSPYVNGGTWSPERLKTPVEIQTQFDPTVTDKLYKTIDDLVLKHLSSQRSPDRSILLQKNNYATPIKTQEPTSGNPLYRSTVFSTTIDPVHKSTPSTYANDYTSPTNYQSPLKYESVSTYQPLSKYEPYSSTYEPVSTYQPTYNYHSTYSPSKYEPSSTYQSKYEPYTSTYTPLSTYQPTYNYETSPYYSQYQPSTSDYEYKSGTRPKYVRPLYRNTPEKYRPQVSWSDNKLSTPARDSYTNNDNNSTDRKMKKLMLKSKPSEERDGERESYRSRRDYGKKGNTYSSDAEKLTFRNTDTDNEGPVDLLPLPLPVLESPVPDHKKANTKHRAGDLQADDNHHAAGLLSDEDSEQEWTHQRKQVEEKPVRKTSNNAPDDGKEWKMVHRLPGHLLEEPESPFNFEVGQRKKPTRKVSSNRKSKAEIWEIDESLDVSHTRSISDLSQSVKKSKKKPLISHCFEKSDRLGY